MFRPQNYSRAEEIIQLTFTGLPTGLMRIRHYGVLGNRCRTQQLSACRLLLEQASPSVQLPASTVTLMRRLTGIDIERCPHCRRGRLKAIMMIYPLWQIDLLPGETQPP